MTQLTTSYKTYWATWFGLLLITVGMVFIGSTPLLVSGMLLKAALILFVFMHLRYEKTSLVLTVLIGIFATSLILALLIVPDGRAM